MTEYVFFDLDGTLTESTEGICNAARYALEKFGIIETDITRLERYIGPPLDASFAEYGLDKEQVRQAIAYFREYYNRQGKYENRVYDGIPEVLSSLLKKGKKLVVATSKPEHFANQILEHFGILQYFSFVAGATVDEKRTHKDEVIAYALQKLGIKDRSSVLMVGDREYDVVGAKEKNIDCLGVLYGYGSREELERAGAVYIAETVEDILLMIP